MGMLNKLNELRGDDDAENEPAAPKDPFAHARGNAAEWVHVDDLEDWGENPRKNEDAAKKLAKLIVKLGFGTPALAWRNPGGTVRVLAGHTRKKAVNILRRLLPTITPKQRAKWHADAIRTAESGLVPVRIRDDLTESQAKQLAIADNKSNEWAEWDEGLLAQHLSDMNLSDVGDMGFDVAKYCSDDFGLGDGKSKATDIEEIDLTACSVDFVMTVTGPLRSMQPVVEQLRKALGKIEGVTVDVSTSEM